MLINGVDAQTLPLTQLRRSLGYVFQRIGLFPHMTLERNISIVLEIEKQPLKKRQHRAHELLELINLNPNEYAHRYPDELSGGQMQRVGVARALASNPACLLMDEPFGALDAITRNNLQDELIELKKTLQKTIVFVTHDIAEAMKLGDKIAVLHNGVIEQIGTPHDITHNPQSAFVSQLLHSAHDYQEQEIPS